jgi:hypothetical protein
MVKGRLSVTFFIPSAHGAELLDTGAVELGSESVIQGVSGNLNGTAQKECVELDGG